MSQSYCLVTCCSVADGSWREDWTVIWSHINRKQMTSINLQFMLFFKPLSVHSRSIMWRPDGREKKREGERRRKSCYMSQSILAVQKRCHRVGLIVLYRTNKTVALSSSLYCDMTCIYSLPLSPISGCSPFVTLWRCLRKPNTLGSSIQALLPFFADWRGARPHLCGAFCN